MTQEELEIRRKEISEGLRQFLALQEAPRLKISEKMILLACDAVDTHLEWRELNKKV
jgi:hypothetical protein